VLENHKTWTLRAGEPLRHRSVDCLGVGASGDQQSPILGVLVPEDGLQTEQFLRDSPYTVVGVAIWGSPVPRQSAACGILDDFHGPTEFRDNLEV